jgi:hypothetical protein
MWLKLHGITSQDDAVQLEEMMETNLKESWNGPEWI